MGDRTADRLDASGKTFGDEPGIRFKLADLPARPAAVEDELDRALHRLGAPAGAACERSCDCRIGLVCRDGTCQGDW